MLHVLRNSPIYDDQSGFTLVNMLTTLSLIAILSAIAISDLKEVNSPLVDSSFQITHFLREARSKAMSKTVTVKVSPISAYSIKAEQGNSCSPTETFTPLSPTMQSNLPNGASLTDTTWEICFTKRGLASQSSLFLIQDEEGQTRTVEVALGGASRIQ